MRHEAWTEGEAAVFADLLDATARLLDRLGAVRDEAERAALGAAFEARIAELRDDVARRHALDARAADAAVARALASLADLLQGVPVA